MLTPKQISEKSDELALRKELEAAGAKFRGRACKCPFHDDKHPSAGIYRRSQDHYWHFKCATCQIDGDVYDIRARVNKTKSDDELKKDGEHAPKKTEPPVRVFSSLEAIVSTFIDTEAVYRYTNPGTGEVEFAVIRWRRPDGKKCFTQCSPTAGGWWMKKPSGLSPLYNRARVRASESVIVVEGEKCVHALHEIGIVATTSPGGALNGHLTDWSPLAGKTVYLWPDNDPENPTTHPRPGERTGIEHMKQVQKILQMLTPPPIVHWIDPDSLELPEKGDVVDFLAPYANAEEKRVAVEAVLGDSEPVGLAADYLKEMQATTEGKRRTLPLGPWAILSNASRALCPATVTCVCGDPGSGKSLWLMEAMVAWQECGINACVYQLEEDRNYHLRRAHAQAARCSDLTDNEWCEKNASMAMELTKHHRQRLDELGRRVWDAPEEQASHEMLTAWMEQRAKDGFEVIAIDPITAAATDEKPWIADLKFINRAKTIARRYGCRIILVTHPKASSKPAGGIHSLAGGAAYSRFAQTVLWIERNDAEAEMAIRKNPRHPPEVYTPSRIIKITKARNGPGAGKRIAFDFEAASLTFKEIGLVEKA